jgi:uncharacterized protein
MNFQTLLKWISKLLLLTLLMSSLNGCAWLDTRQRTWIYRPTPGLLRDWQPITPRDEAIWLQQPASSTRPDMPGHRLRALWIPSSKPHAPAVLYLHGTFRNVFQNRHKIASIHAAGFNVLAVDYRGWGESTPQLPSEATIMEDAELAWSELQRREPDAKRRIIFGHSMGSGVAVELAVRHQLPQAYGVVVLESALTSLPDVARDFGGFWGRLAASLTTQQFASIHKISQIAAPKWFLSGTKDRTVPPAHAQRLFDAAREPKQLIWFEGGTHSELNQEFAQRYRAVWQSVSKAVLTEQAPPILSK